MATNLKRFPFLHRLFGHKVERKNSRIQTIYFHFISLECGFIRLEQCSVVSCYTYFGEIYCFSPEDGGGTFLHNIGKDLQD